jgi:hypothetical protein
MNKLLSATILSSTFFLMNHSYALTIENKANGREVGSWGGGAGTEIYGQTFKLTDSQYNKLDNFTFYLKAFGNPSTIISFDAYIYKWDFTSNKIIGNAVFEQKNLSSTINNTNFTPITINTENTELESNQQYFIFLSSISYPLNSAVNWQLGGATDGHFVYFNTSSFSDVLNSSFNSYSRIYLAYILNFSQGLSAQDTMASMQNNILGLNQLFTMQANALENSLSQKCSYFNNDNFCVSFSANYAQANNSSNTDATSGIVNVAYKINPNFYVGGSLEQIVSDVNYSDVSYRQTAPDVSVYTGWNQNDNTEGLNAHIAYRYSNGKVDIKRDQIASAEAGQGRSDLITNAWYASLGNTFNIQNKALVTPYIAARYSDIERKAYTENLSNNVTTPLSYDDLNRKTTTAIVGVEAVTALTPKVNISGTIGYENDLNKKFSDYSATGIDGLTPLDFNDDYKNNRLFLSTGLDYNFAKNQNIGLNISYRESAFTPSAVTSASIVYQTSF